MNRFDQQVFDGAVDLRELLAAGGKRKMGFGRPPYEGDERLLARTNQMTSRRTPLRANRASIERDGLGDDKGKLKPEGGLYVTDRRAILMGNFGKVLQIWSWHELSAVSVIHGYLGVRFVRPTDTDTSDAALHVYNKWAVFDPSTASVAQGLVKVEGSYVLGTGQDYDAWLARLSQRFA